MIKLSFKGPSLVFVSITSWLNSQLFETQVAFLKNITIAIWLVSYIHGLAHNVPKKISINKLLTVPSIFSVYKPSFYLNPYGRPHTYTGGVHIKGAAYSLCKLKCLHPCYR